MSEKSDQKVRASMFTPLIALLAMLAQAVASYAQTSVNEQAGNSSQPAFFDLAWLDLKTPYSIGPALLALADVAGTATAASGGLWLSGDTSEGFRYLQWIAGNQPTGLLYTLSLHDALPI